MVKKPVVLCILDGWGDEKSLSHNAPKLANTPTFDSLIGTYPNAHLRACGSAVGLPDGQMGNSEVGHMNIGAGRIVLQTLPRIDTSSSGARVVPELQALNVPRSTVLSMFSSSALMLKSEALSGDDCTCSSKLFQRLRSIVPRVNCLVVTEAGIS